MTWPLPELDVGVDDGELRLGVDELLEPELPVLDVAWCVPVAVEPDEEWEAAEAAPGRLTATAPAATMLTAAAETVAARSRLRPRSRSAMPGDVPSGGMLCLLMPASLAARFPIAL